MSIQLGRLGIWTSHFRSGDPHARAEAAAQLESFGYGTIWIPGGAGGDIFGDVTTVLEATERIAVATGILNIWMHDPAEVAASHQLVTSAHPGRFLLGLGISHAMLVNAKSLTYERPLEVTAKYLDALDKADPPVPVAERALAALGPRMLTLARDRTAGAHPYLVTPEHTAVARQILGSGPLLAPEQAVVVETDPGRARQIGRQHLKLYLQLPNYTNNWLRHGYTPDDLAEGGSDRLVDGLVAWGDEQAILSRIQAHRDAGADHVCLQVLPREGETPVDQWQRLAQLIST